jgi:hypothetical protein
MNVLEQRPSNFGIEVECGASEVSLEGDSISGKWLSVPKVVRIGAPRPVAVELLNATESVSVDRFPEAALKFTKEFGALTSPFRSGETFRFSVSDWIVKQKGLQTVWAMVSRASRNAVPVNVFADSREYFSFRAGRLTFRTQSLDTFVSLEIASVSPPRLCVCANRLQGCKAPFFIAGDLRERYCSETCAQEGKRLAKLRWWNENRKGKQRGAQKTR